MGDRSPRDRCPRDRRPRDRSPRDRSPRENQYSLDGYGAYVGIAYDTERQREEQGEPGKDQMLDKMNRYYEYGREDRERQNIRDTRNRERGRGRRGSRR